MKAPAPKPSPRSDCESAWPQQYNYPQYTNGQDTWSTLFHADLTLRNGLD